MLCRRGLASLGAVINSISKLSLTCNTSAAPNAVQQLATLTSFRQLQSWQAAGAFQHPVWVLGRSYSAAAAAGSPPGPGPTESLEQVRARIFGTYVGNGLRSGRKVLRGKLLGPTLVAYYPQDLNKKDPFMLDMKAERAKLKLDRLKRRGKAPPKKGSGKRAGKKK